MVKLLRVNSEMVVDMELAAIEIVMVSLFVKVIGKMITSSKRINEKQFSFSKKTKNMILHFFITFFKLNQILFLR